MKKIFILFFVIGVAVCYPKLSFAQDSELLGTVNNLFDGAFGPMSSRIISDPLFLPLRGQVYGTTGYTFTRPVYDSLNYKGSELAFHRGSDNTFTQTAAYGITDDFTVRISESYEDNRSDDTSAKTGDLTTDNSKGFTNPTIGATYRVLDQAQYPVDFDLITSYSPNAIKNIAGNDGTVASGRQTLVLAAGLGREMKMFTIQGTADATYLGQQDYITSANYDNYTTKEGWEYGFGLNTQTRFTDRISLNLGVDYTLANNLNVANLTSGLGHISVPADTLSFPVSLNYQIIPDKLVGSLTYSYDDYTNSKSLYPAAPNDNSSTEKHSANAFGVRVSYLFF